MLDRKWKISDVIVMANEYCGGETFGPDKKGELYKGAVSLVNVGLNSVLYNHSTNVLAYKNLTVKSIA